MLTERDAVIRHGMRRSGFRDRGRVRVDHLRPRAGHPGGAQRVRGALDADLAGWSFLPGEPEVVREVGRRYGVAVAAGPEGQIDHSLLATLIDRQGAMRVQYLGYRFDEEEFRRDLESLASEP